jgi:PhzF family phenazine biosynthesis protein
MPLPLYWIDAFTDRVFAGNPAAVVPLDAWLPDALMQRIAFENGLAETAFFVKTGEDRFHLRWFTPGTEVDLCGHATLATAFVVFTQLGASGDVLTFDSRSGPLRVERLADGKIELDFPVTPASAENDASILAAVSVALGVSPRWLGRSRFDLFAELPDADAVRNLRPDFARIAALGGRGLIVTARGDGEDCDFVSRFFAPQSAIPEDPVTGSAHCALTPYWSAHLGKQKLSARQLSARGGALWCELADDRVKIAGHAVLYLKGVIEV